MAIRDVRNSDMLALSAPPASDWLPNLKDKDLDPVVVDAFRRLHEVTQQIGAQVTQTQDTIKQMQSPAPVPVPVLTTFVEFTLGSPQTGAIRFRAGRGTPEGVLEGSAQKDIYYRVDGAAGTFCYAKETGEGKSGWVAKF